MRLKLCAIGFVKFQNFHFPAETGLHRAEADRNNASITFERFNHLNLFHTRRALPDLIWICHKIPDFFSWSAYDNVTFELHVMYLVEEYCRSTILRYIGGCRLNISLLY